MRGALRCPHNPIDFTERVNGQSNHTQYIESSDIVSSLPDNVKSDVCKIDLNHVRDIVTNILTHKNVLLTRLPLIIKNDYIRLTRLVYALNDSPYYKYIHRIVKQQCDKYIDDFDNVLPGTVGGYLVKCIISSEDDIIIGDHVPMNILKDVKGTDKADKDNSGEGLLRDSHKKLGEDLPRDLPTRLSQLDRCSRSVIVGDYYPDDGFYFNIVVDGQTANNNETGSPGNSKKRKSGYVLIQEKEFPGLSIEEKTQLYDMGIEYVKLLGFKLNGDHITYKSLSDNFVDIKSLKTRGQDDTAASHHWLLVSSIVFFLILCVIFGGWNFWKRYYGKSV